MEEIHRGRFVCLCSSLCPLYILGRMNCCERRSLWAVGLTYRHEGKSSPDYCCCGMDSFSWSSQHEGHPSCLVSSSPFVLDWCVHVYVHPYLCVCVCVYVCGDLMFVQCFLAHTGTVSSCTAHLYSHLDVAGKKKKIWHCWFLQGCD